MGMKAKVRQAVNVTSFMVFSWFKVGRIGTPTISVDLAGRRFGTSPARAEIGRDGMSVVVHGKRADSQRG